MYFEFHYKPGEIKRSTFVYGKMESIDLPVLAIDKDSYIIGAKVESGLDLKFDDKLHNIQIGKYCSLAENILFMIDINHDFLSVYQGEISEYKGITKPAYKRRKGEILIQNDCWIGEGTTIMNGVTIHNGAVVAAKSVVTKDVPPYTIVGGNPAKVIKKRFDDDIIDALQKIRWWDWDSQKLLDRKNDLNGDVHCFTEKYLPEAQAKLDHSGQKCFFERNIRNGKIFAYCIDAYSEYSLYPRIISEFCNKYCNMDAQLVLYFPDLLKSKLEHVNIVLAELDKFSEKDCCISLVYDDDATLESIIRNCDVYITNREQYNIYATCLADLFKKEIISGFNLPVFV